MVLCTRGEDGLRSSTGRTRSPASLASFCKDARGSVCRFRLREPGDKARRASMLRCACGQAVTQRSAQQTHQAAVASTQGINTKCSCSAQVGCVGRQQVGSNLKNLEGKTSSMMRRRRTACGGPSSCFIKRAPERLPDSFGDHQHHESSSTCPPRSPSRSTAQLHHQAGAVPAAPEHTSPGSCCPCGTL